MVHGACWLRGTYGPDESVRMGQRGEERELGETGVGVRSGVALRHGFRDKYYK